MFDFTLLVHSCIFALVTTNPSQGFPSNPVIQYQNELSTLAEPWNLNSYSQLTTQNQLSQLYNDYVKRTYLNNVLQNQINSAVDSNDQYGYKVRRYASDPVTDVVNNYFIIPTETIEQDISTVECKKKKRKRKTNAQKTNKKCRKINKCKNINEDKKECSRNRPVNGEDNDNFSNNNHPKVCKRNKSQHKRRKSYRLKEKENVTDTNEIVDIPQQSNRKYSNLKVACNQNSNDKDSNKNKHKCSGNLFEHAGNSKRKCDKTNKCRKQMKKDDYNCDQMQELDDYFNINEDCVHLENRCVRNGDKVKNQNHQYYTPIDFAPYMIFNQQMFDTNDYFSTNFDNFFKMLQSPAFNLNGSIQKPKNRETNNKKKQDNRNKKNSNNSHKDSKQRDDRCKNESKKEVELSPNFVELVEGSTPVSTESYNTQIETIFKEHGRGNSFKLSNDPKEKPPSNCLNSNQQSVVDYIDDYYPDFHSANFYSSKEDEYDWNNFHDRHYYSSNNMNDLDRDNRNFGYNGNDGDFQNDKNIKHGAKVKSSTNIKITTKENEDNDPITVDIYNEEEKEEIQFRIPPALDFPDFKTEMINKDEYTPKTEIYYKPNESGDKKYKENKMSVYSNIKYAESNDIGNKIVDQNNVETVLGHSKVIKYGVSPNDEGSSKINNFNERQDGGNLSDGQTVIVVAKSLPYPI